MMSPSDPAPQHDMMSPSDPAPQHDIMSPSDPHPQHDMMSPDPAYKKALPVKNTCFVLPSADVICIYIYIYIYMPTRESCLI